MKMLKLISEWYEYLGQYLGVFAHSLHQIISSKISLITLGSYAGYVTVDGVVEIEKQHDEFNFISLIIDYFLSMNPTQFLGFVALLLLVIDRSFVVWLWIRRIRRGDYNLPNVGKKK